MQPEQWDPIIAEGKGRDLRGTIIMGGQDRFVPGTERLVSLLREADIACEFDVHPDMGHDYPADFKTQLSGLLAFALGEKPA
jgi:acetyl esterase/lipase